MIKKQILRFKSRRSYKPIYSEHINSEIIKNYSFKNTLFYNSKVIISNENLILIKKCKKSGSWVNVKLMKRNLLFWTSRNLKLIKGNNLSLFNARNFGIDVISSATITKLCNITVKGTSIESSLNIYDHKIIDNGNIDFDEAFYMCVNGSDQFQHFIQDFLPILAFVEPFLQENSAMPLILKKSIKNVMHYEFYFDLLEIKNPRIYINENDIGIKNLYILNFLPINALYCLPQNLYTSLYKAVTRNKTYQISPKQNFVLFTRKEITRNFANEEFLVDELKFRCSHLGLNLIVLNPRNTDLISIITALSNAKYVMGMHGGALYNMLFAAQDSTLIEFITTDSSDSLAHMIRSFGLNYMPYAIDADKGTNEIQITKADLDFIFCSISGHT